MRNSSDRLLGIAGLVLSGLIIWGAFLIKESFIQDPLGPRAFPIVIAVVIGLASATVLVRPDEEPVWPALPRLLEIGVAVVALIAYAQFLPIVGFVLSTAVCGGFLSWRLGTPPLKAALAGLLISGGIFLVFRIILGLSLARGPWGF
ncbi:tripartite tricarboxylate transporter TctB family protein [Devosia neptuniae]|jgi:putative tricarboxylic transport membrane protein|uniref:tripartite tricarboxylate transporter TctB family protein n=1 Tax=Devosia TaxID=46913 RepID=UPI0022AF465C|nr:tripartite tricarboxylate transporter TctB family protein [Devosia neptuniae]MCZ4345409.1 tripartite tricarboxylate transporter TctB family protein [Devosia neptuniae]|tara:strand:- start:269570 stop:270010 length:441 start_codon:yes stop_codon:yes gene_type:complete